MEFIRYEYQIINEYGEVIIGSFTLKVNADKSVVDELNAHEVERFII